MKQVPAIVLSLRSGGDYKPEHVVWLKEQLQKNTTLPFELVVYSDMSLDGALPFEHDYPGWWSCVELWRHKGPTIAIGLDTMVLGNINGLLEFTTSVGPEEFFLLSSPFHKGELVNGMQIWNGDWSWLYEEFDYDDCSSKYRGDENYMIDALVKRGVNIGRIQDHFPGIYNYKKEYLNRKVKDARILIFHGKPRPWNSPVWRKR